MSACFRSTFAALLSLLAAGCGPGDSERSRAGNTGAPAQATAIHADEIQATARDAYIYGFPMVVGYKTLYNYVIDTDNPEYKGPFNEIACEARLFTPNDKAVVTPNADTPYCMFWLDLRAEPLVLSVPKIESERFYHFQFIDLYTHNYAYVGTLTSGNGPGKFLLVGPDWSDAAPDGVDQVIRSETDLVFVAVRTQLFDSDDLPRIEEIQQSYDIQPLSEFAQTLAPGASTELTFPIWVEGAQFDERSFEYIDFMLQLLGSPTGEEVALRERMANIGIVGEGDFELAAVSDSTREALAAGVQDGFAAIEKFAQEISNDPIASAKIFGTREFLEDSARTNYGLENPHLPRAVAAHRGLYGNSATEAVYPTYLADAEGTALDASKNSYTLTFAEGSLPPVKAFWSLTMYDGKTQLFVPNSLDRYLLNSTTMDDYVFEEDGSLVLYISKESPGDLLEANWLPAPDGPFYLTLRLYGPPAEALDGEWTPPGLAPTQ